MRRKRDRIIWIIGRRVFGYKMKKNVEEYSVVIVMAENVAGKGRGKEGESGLVVWEWGK